MADSEYVPVPDTDATRPLNVGIPFLLPEYPTLGDNIVGRAAVNGQLVRYPQIARDLTDPPIPQQQFVNISYMLLDDPRTLENGKREYGMLNVRGTWPTRTAAEKDGKRIIREVDSRNLVLVVPVGQWIKITDDTSHIGDKIDVKTDDDDSKPALRDEVALRRRREEERKIREIKEHEEEMLAEERDPRTVDELENTLEGYIKKRVKEITHLEIRQKFEEQMHALDYLMTENANVLAVLERDHPEYSTQWLEGYNDQRNKYGVPSYTLSEVEREYHDTSVAACDPSVPFEVDPVLKYHKISMI